MVHRVYWLPLKDLNFHSRLQRPMSLPLDETEIMKRNYQSHAPSDTEVTDHFNVGREGIARRRSGWCLRQESNLRRQVLQTCALPSELQRQMETVAGVEPAFPGLQPGALAF